VVENRAHIDPINSIPCQNLGFGNCFKKGFILEVVEGGLGKREQEKERETATSSGCHLLWMAVSPCL
jgi:hypothetical protein